MNLPNGYFLKGKKYRLTHTIGQGGFGITYLGVWNTEVKGELGAMKTTVPICIKEYFFKDYCYRDKNTQAVKVHSQTGEKLFGKFKEKLIEEANILSAVHHPNIVNVLEVFEENNTAYIVMEYIKGCSLKYLLDKEGVLPEYKVIKYTHQIGNALTFVHDKNIVHLDIKPGNILIDQDDNARLIDFGVSKRYDIEEQETSTTTLTLSKGFASIEQYDDEGMLNFSAAPDIYALGATMYNLLTNVIPVESILRATKQMLPPTAYNSTISRKTEKAILKAMEIKPEDRFRTVNELLVTIDAPMYDFTSENTLTETNRIDEEDNTELLHGKEPNLSDDEEDRTIIKSTDDVPKQKKKRKRRHKTKRRVAIVISILLCAFLGYAVFDYFFKVPADYISDISMPGDSLKSETQTPEKQVDSLDLDEPDVSGVSDVANQPRTDSVKTEKPEQNVPVQPQNNNPQPTATTVNNGLTNNNPATNTAKPAYTAAEIAAMEKEYQALIDAGNDKMLSLGKYAEALDDFKKASDIAKKTGKDMSEVNSRMDDCTKKMDEQKNEQEKEARKANYETFDKWGDLVIVCNKENNKYGAVDASFREIIKCKYITVNRISSNDEIREFVIDESRGDIYDKYGKLKKEAVELDTQ